MSIDEYESLRAAARDNLLTSRDRESPKKTSRPLPRQGVPIAPGCVHYSALDDTIARFVQIQLCHEEEQ